MTTRVTVARKVGSEEVRAFHVDVVCTLWSPGNFRYRADGLASGGIGKVQLRTAKNGTKRVKASGKGSALLLPALPLAMPVRLQLRSGAACWEATYVAGRVKRNTESRFQAVAP